ncbi:outer membrane beta-barrel protein [Mucilaginibacter phyllosphaerae]|uniref:PorT family protein n=1 Tax=Mucilaginibacter phyllosphaerae TaxID=1812349 RepID=A0A4Y8A7Q4_9SPHI|nr:outer membrane beta-barrel protein [Mucilaginibacter phyllosphaerae]MBB3971093.1 hypothetical protein [Mucilaginibacter phyllosphaerae]TEW63828.1 PorT family protein [Mucilaginibacter phyllosphaerae]GGH22427.1 hypothetical protein GCM10007352_35730 [Mucilaginibacter phyllosphaerae]
MKFFYTICFFLLAYPACILAQANYKPAFIVKNNGDTTRGFIDYKEQEQNPKLIHFKSLANANESKVLSVSDILAFGIFNVEYFERYKLQISQDEINPTNLADKAIDTTFKTDVVFVKVIVKGKYINLYKYTDSLKTRFYMTANSSSIAELAYHLKPNFGQVTQSTSNFNYIVIDKYKQQLMDLVKDANVINKNLIAKIKRTNYNERELKGTAEKINGNYITFSTQSLFGYRFFIEAGANFSKFNLSGEGNFPQNTTVSSSSPSISAGANLFLNKYTQKIFFRTEIGFNAHHYAYKDVLSQFNNNVTSSLDFKQSTLFFKFLPAVNIYNQSGIKAFINAGPAINLSFYNKYQFIENFYNSSQKVSDQYPEFSKIWLNLHVNAGVEIAKKLIISAGYSPNARITQLQFVTANIQSYQLGVTYLFAKM